MNVFVFDGNVARDAELKYTTNGKPICRFTVPVKKGFGEHEKTTWVNCVMFGKKAEALASYITKGKKVVCSGELHLNEFDKKDGTKGAGIEVSVNDISFGSSRGESKSDGNESSGAGDVGEPPVNSGAYGDDDLPF